MSRHHKGDWVWIDAHGETFMPDRRITVLATTHLLRPCRGSSTTLAVEDIHDRIIGWMSVEDAPGGPYERVAHWIAEVGYIERGA